MYENYCKLRDLKGLKDSDVARGAGITKSTFTDWKNGRSAPKNEKLQKIADYFGVTINYLMTGKDDNTPQITAKDERDIEKSLAKIMDEIKNKDDGPLYYDGVEIDDTSLALLENALNSALHQMKIINKEKYNPNKNKNKK